MDLNYRRINIRSSTVLTGSYVESTILGPEDVPTASPIEQNKLLLNINFTIGSLTSAEIKVEFSDDGITYFQETNLLTSGALTTLTLNENVLSATGKYVLSIDLIARYVKVSAKGTGTVTGSLLAIDAILAVR